MGHELAHHEHNSGAVGLTAGHKFQDTECSGIEFELLHFRQCSYGFGVIGDLLELVAELCHAILQMRHSVALMERVMKRQSGWVRRRNWLAD